MKDYLAIIISAVGVAVVLVLAIAGVIGSDHDAITQLRQQVTDQAKQLDRLEASSSNVVTLSERLARVEEQVRTLDAHLVSRIDGLDSKLLRMENKIDLLGQLIYEAANMQSIN